MSKQLNRLSLNKAAALVAIVVGVGGGSYGLASAASGTGTATTTTTTAVAAAPSPSGATAQDPWGHQRSDETLLTGDALAKVTGPKPLPRSEVAKKLWVYIKKNGLQDQKNKRMINADDVLKAVFNGKKQVSMFEMTALVSKHLK